MEGRLDGMGDGRFVGSLDCFEALKSPFGEGRLDGMGDGRGTLACFEALKSLFGPFFASAPTTKKAAIAAFHKFIFVESF